MKISVVILNWNGSQMMQKYLPSVVRYSQLRSGEPVEVVVADNGSTDDSLEMLTREFPMVRQIVLPENYGFAEGYNKAFEQCDAEYAVLLNSDVEVTEGWLDPLADYLDTHADVAAAQPKLKAWYDKKMFEYAGACGGYLDKYGYPFCRGRIFGVVEEDKGQYDGVHDILWATGACLFIRLKDYKDAGGLDGRFFAHNEEIDLCWRLNLYGRRIVCITDSTVYHLGGGTLPQGNPRKTYLNFRNNLTMLYKNLPDSRLKRVMRMRFFLDYLAALQSLLTGHWGDVKAIRKARRDFYAWRSSYALVRKDIQQRVDRLRSSQNDGGDTSAPNLRTSYGITDINILWHFHGLRHHKFSQLG